jgi:hypothetical protein
VKTSVVSSTAKVVFRKMKPVFEERNEDGRSSYFRKGHSVKRHEHSCFKYIKE